jgi:hypothetical protein
MLALIQSARFIWCFIVNLLSHEYGFGTLNYVAAANGLASLAGRVRRECLCSKVNRNARGAIEKRADSPVKCKPGLAPPALHPADPPPPCDISSHDDNIDL